METIILEKSAWKAADNSTCSNLDNFEINTNKSQGNESFLVAQLKENILSLESDRESARQISE